jgi:hypothetical protein
MTEARAEQRAMRFLILLKGDDAAEMGASPDERHTRALAAYDRDLAKASVLQRSGRLERSATGFRMALQPDGKLTVEDGPFSNRRDLVAGFWLLRVETNDDAIAWVRRFPNEGRARGALEFRAVTDEMEVPTPSEAPAEGGFRFVLMFTESGGGNERATAELIQEMRREGVLMASANVMSGEPMTFFCAVRVSSRREVFRWAWRGLKARGAGACEVRAVL